jgi:hypothetical protein
MGSDIKRERRVPQPLQGAVVAGDRHGVVSRRGRSRQCVLAQHSGRSDDCHAHRSMFAVGD